MKKKLIIAIILVLTLSGAGTVAYRSYALEKEWEKQEAIHVSAVETARKMEEAQNKKVIAEWQEKVYPGVSVMGEDLSGMTLPEVKNLLETKILEAVKTNALTVVVKDKEFTLSLADLDVALDTQSMSEYIVSLGKSLEETEKLQRIYTKTLEEVEVPYTYSEEKLIAYVKSIASEINVSAKNATIKKSGDGFTVTEHQTGMVLEEEKLIASLKEVLPKLEPGAKLEASLVIDEPKVTSDALKMIDGRLSTFTTNYSTSAAGRKHNVGFAASLINGTVLMPGETFSYNAEIGPVTLRAGFKNAGVIIGDKIEDGVGGGLCQVSSTLYQAALHSNMGIEQRRNHSMAVAYLKPGMDAVVYGPYLDLKFKNNYPNPVYIQAYGDNNNLSVSIYGHQADLGGYSYKVFSETTSVLQPTIKKVEDNTLFVGEEVVEKKPVTGYTSKTYRQTIKDGKVVKTEVISQDSYKKVDGVIRVGTKAKPAAPEAPAPESPAPEAPTDPAAAPNG
ncbi:VanW family protein [Proteiniclasticum ruminis]|uniref:VanW family protein n=1 Tax=Proteiniclasticum ruminis TaxID=398199 RepID=UPI0028ACB9C1|nr:VanW family protein [Proteiniclasticum ruminis]